MDEPLEYPRADSAASEASADGEGNPRTFAQEPWEPLRTHEEVMHEYNRRHPDDPLTYNQVRKAHQTAIRKLKRAMQETNE